MIGLILGTSEGRKILSSLNKYTDDIFLSTATEYGGEILKSYRYSYLNTKPLPLEGLIHILQEKKVKQLVDATHPYALEVTKNAIRACEVLHIEYIRYERPSSIEKFRTEEYVVEIKGYEELYEKLKAIEGTILNTTGSKSLDRILSMKLENRIIHRVLPSMKVMKECFDKGIKIEDIVAMKGPIGYELNCAFIKQYDAKAMILKDSGVEGATEEKLKACINNNIYGFVIERKSLEYKNVFQDVEELVRYLVSKNQWNKLL